MVIGTSLAGCKDTAMTNIIQDIEKWTGAVSSDWHDANNWNNGRVPDTSTHVIIPGGTAHACVISNADAKAASVQGVSAGSLSIINNRKLWISARCGSLPPVN